MLSTLASLGGSFEEAVIENGDYRLTVHLATSANVRRLIEAVEETYPSVEMVTRRQTTRPNEDEVAHDTGVDELTDRQRAALQAAYHSGFFEWPRDSSGEDVADSLDVAPPTFHNHLRKAQKKVIGAALAPGQQ